MRLKAPLLVGIQITKRCNLDCKYCYSWPHEEVDIPKSKVYELIDELMAIEVFYIVIDGGEPFLHPQIEDIIHYCKDNRVPAAFVSNGTIFSPLFQKFADYLGNKLQISIDSVDPQINDLTRGKSKLVLQNIEKLINLNYDLTLGTVVTRYNADVVGEIIDQFYPRIKSYHFMNIVPTPKAVKHWGALNPSEEQIKQANFILKEKENKYKDCDIRYPYEDTNKELGKESLSCEGCLAGITQVTITPDLKVVGCPTSSKSIIGEVNEKSFKEVWSSAQADLVRKFPKPFCGENLEIGSYEEKI